MQGYNIILYFATYSFIGWVMESLYFSIPAKTFVNRGFLSGFICPIYGFGSLIILYIYKTVRLKIKNTIASRVISAIMSMIAVTILEYITGFVLEKIFKCRYWDYSHLKFNINGYVALSHSIFWGILSLVLVLIIHPFVTKLFSNLPPVFKPYIVIFFLGYFVTDITKTVVDTMDIKEVINNYTVLFTEKYRKNSLKSPGSIPLFPNPNSFNSVFLYFDVKIFLHEKLIKFKSSIKDRLPK